MLGAFLCKMQKEKSSLCVCVVCACECARTHTHSYLGISGNPKKGLFFPT